jgi:hypothetical protein
MKGNDVKNRLYDQGQEITGYLECRLRLQAQAKLALPSQFCKHNALL